jgi:copper chaperone NosL
MIKLRKLTFISFDFVIVILLLLSCKHEMRPIEYGKDNCEQCRMTVMNPQFGAGMLTAKGKVFAFDAGECLVRYLRSKGFQEKEEYFVSNYSAPGTLINARTAIFLHGDSIQSPMGGNLAAFSSIESAKLVQHELGGRIMKWNDLFKK